MKRVIFSVLALGLAAGCAQAPSAPVEQLPDAGSCATPESGVIRAMSPGLPEMRLSGPFMVTTLQSVIDPYNPRGSTLLWSKDNAAFSVEGFKGPLYLAEGEALSTTKELTPLSVIYSGCRLE